MGMLLKAVSLCVQYPCECSVTAVHAGSKDQKSVSFESPVSSDLQQVAFPEMSRSTNGHAAKEM